MYPTTPGRICLSDQQQVFRQFGPEAALAVSQSIRALDCAWGRGDYTCGRSRAGLKPADSGLLRVPHCELHSYCDQRFVSLLCFSR